MPLPSIDFASNFATLPTKNINLAHPVNFTSSACRFFTHYKNNKKQSIAAGSASFCLVACSETVEVEAVRFYLISE
jgi:hypothetical protein